MNNQKEIKTVESYQREADRVIKKLYSDLGLTPNDTAKAVFAFQAAIRLEEIIKDLWQAGVSQGEAHIGKTKRQWYERGYREGEKKAAREEKV